MLRQCIRGASRRHGRFRQGREWSSSSSPIASWDPRSSDDDDAVGGNASKTTAHPSAAARRSLSSCTASSAAAPRSALHVGRHGQRPSVRYVAGARRFSISRHPDPLAKHGSINTLDEDDAEGAAVVDDGDDDDDRLLTADDLEFEDNIMSKKMSETGGDIWGDDDDDDENDGGGGGGEKDDYGDIFGDLSLPSGGDDDADDDDADHPDKTPEEKAFQKRQAEIKAELDNRTGRLWTDNWIITDEEWMTDTHFDDIEDWKPTNATRVSLEKVKVFDRGVPTLGELAELDLPKSPPPHPGHGEPGIYAKHRKRQIKRKLHTSIQLAIHDDLVKMLKMESWDEKQEAVDALYEAVADRVREREPILAKLPDFGNMVEKGLEDVLLMVQSNMKGVREERKREMDEELDGQKDEAADDDESAEEEQSPDDQEEGEVLEEKIRELKQAGSGGGEASATDTFVEKAKEIVDVMGVNAEPPVPIFMDVLAAANRLSQQQQQPESDGEDGEGGDAAAPSTPALPSFFSESNGDDVPNLVYPLNVHHNDGVGRMVEEWQLAANKDTKRIMMRDAMKEIATRVVDAARCCGAEAGEEEKGAARVFVVGKRGVGKTATLAGIVASARLSGHIVVYLPDGDRLRKHGFYIEPCNYRKGLYNLPEIAKEFSSQLLTSHGDDIKSMPAATKEDMKPFFTEDQIGRLFKRAYKEDESVTEEEVASMTELSLDKVLTVGTESSALSSGCYSTVISKLTNQTRKPFTVVMDEFNCYYDHGHYFHMDYDFDVRRAVPLNRITILKPFLDAMGLYPAEAGTEISENADADFAAAPSEEAMMKWGSIIVSTSESRAVKRSFTRSLTDAAHGVSRNNDGNRYPLHVVDMQRFSDVEVQHVLYNFEITGVGRLRFDRGDTALNPEEVDYLRMVSGGSGQQLLDSCMIRV